MTLLHVSDVATAIAALTIPGVTVIDLDEMPDAVDTRRFPMLGPSANNPSFLTDWVAVRLTLQGNQHNTYTLNYTLFFATVGQERGLFKLYPDMVTCVETVIGVLQAQPRVDGCKSLTVNGAPSFGPVFDASGQQFHGATLALRVTEF